MRLPTFPGLPRLKLGKIVLNPYVQVGYQNVGCNISFPIGVEEVLPMDTALQIGTMELWLTDAAFWTGTVGLNVVVSPSLSLFCSAGGFSPKAVGAPSVLPVRIGGISLPSQIDFTGTNVEYWIVQAGASFGIGGGWSVLAGYLGDHFAMAAVDPRIGAIPYPNQTLRADFLTKSFIPFIGLQLNNTQLKYRASIIYSPLAQCRSLMASRNSQGGVSELTYLFNKPGQFLAVYGEYDVEFSKSLFLSLWATASWMKVLGDGSWEFTSSFRSIHVEKTQSDASVSKYSTAGGIGLGLVF